MHLKKFILSIGLFGFITVLVANEEPQIVTFPATPVCMGKTCPYVIQKGPYKVSINCQKIKAYQTNFECTLTASDGGTISVSQKLEDDFDPYLTANWLSPTLLEIS